MQFGAGAKTLLVLAATVVVVSGLRVAEPLLVPLLLALVIATLSMPVIEWLRRRKIPNPLAILLAMLLDMSILAGMGGLVGTSINEFYAALPRYQSRSVLIINQTALWLNQHRIRVPLDLYSRLTQVADLVTLISNLLAGVAQVVSKSLLVLLIVVFLLFELGRWRIKIAYALGTPKANMPRVARAAQEVQKYLLAKTVLSLITGVLCGLWVLVCGGDFPLLWGLLAFLLNYIPTIGSIIATIPPVAVALVQNGPGTAIAVLCGYLIINSVLGSLVEPRVLGRALGLSPLVVLLSMVFWGWLWGPIGALLSAPLTMVIKIALAHTDDLRWVAILLGSDHWVAQMHSEWSQSRSVSELLGPNPPLAPDDQDAPPPAVDEDILVK